MRNEFATEDDGFACFFAGETGFVQLQVKRDAQGKSWLHLRQLDGNNQLSDEICLGVNDLVSFLRLHGKGIEEPLSSCAAPPSTSSQSEMNAPKQPNSLSCMEQLKAKHQRAYQPWDAEEDEELRVKWRETHNMAELGEHFGRNPGAIASRLQKLGLVSC